MLKGKIQQDFKPVDAEATPLVPVDDISAKSRIQYPRIGGIFCSLTQHLLHSPHDRDDISELYMLDSIQVG